MDSTEVDLIFYDLDGGRHNLGKAVVNVFDDGTVGYQSVTITNEAFANANGSYSQNPADYPTVPVTPNPAQPVSY